MKKLQMYVPGKSVGGVKLSANENPFGASPRVAEALTAFQNFASYPDGQASELKEKVSDFLSVGTNQLIFGAGGDEVIQMISRSVLSPGDNIIQALPTFSQYEYHAIIEGAEIINVPLKKGTHDLDAMLAAVNGKTKIIWICNPNNPTGTYVNEESLTKFLNSVSSEVLVVVDEAYVEYVVAEDFPNTIKLIGKYPNVVILRTFSKVYGLASFRVGFGVGCADFIHDLEVGRLPFNVASISQSVAVAALSDEKFVAYSISKNVEGLKQYMEFLDEYSISYYPSQANFIFIPSADGLKLGAKILESGYIVRSFPQGIRITIGKKEDNASVISCLRNHLDLLFF